METAILSVDLGARSYDVYVGASLLQRMGDFFPFEAKGRKVFIIYDTAIEVLAHTVKSSFLDLPFSKVDLLAVPGKESSKSFDMVRSVTAWMMDNGVDRQSVVIALGGGVIGDLAGFCASIVLRGLAYIQIPTTLLAQVDSAIGGKTGINTVHGKNLIGSFHQPAAVICDIETLKTLPRVQMASGYAEIVKYALIKDYTFFQWLEHNGGDVIAGKPESLLYAVQTCIRAKAGIVEGDETEKDARLLLNFGHTFGHALETAAGHSGELLHGEAVALGMMMALDLSVRLGHCDPEIYIRVERHFVFLGLPTHAGLVAPLLHKTAERIYEIMLRDKKAQNGALRFVLLNSIGEAFVQGDIDPGIVKSVIRDSLGANKESIREQWKSAFSSQS